MKAKILVIEDHPEVLNTMVFLLEREGCSVVAAQTGVQGMELARDGDFDLITLDIDLPGMSGFEVCRNLMAALPIGSRGGGNICEPLLISLCTSMLFAAFSVSQPDAVVLLTRLAGLRW
jgi:CheY-like chemotaxis protein